MLDILIATAAIELALGAYGWVKSTLVAR